GVLPTEAYDESHATRSVKETRDASFAMDARFMGPPRYFPLTVRVDIQMSNPPSPPRPTPAMNSSVRPSCDRSGWNSANPVLTGSPRFTGADQASWVVRRVETQISNALAPPGVRGRPELNRISFPSART